MSRFFCETWDPGLAPPVCTIVPLHFNQWATDNRTARSYYSLAARAEPFLEKFTELRYTD
jgi:hypothetical protein